MNLLTINMASVVLESLLYGIFLVFFFVNIYLRVSKYSKPRILKELLWNTVVISTIAIFLTCTAHWVLTVVRFFRAVLGSADTYAAILYYADDSQTTQVARSALTEMTMLIGDAVIVSAQFLVLTGVHDIVPVILWFGVLACGIVVACLFSQSWLGHILFTTSAGGWVTANWMLTTIINIYCTVCIAWEIWRTSRAVKDIGDGIFMPVLAILVESAAMWTTWMIFFAVTYQTRSVLEFNVVDLTPLIIAFTNMFIHLRVGLGWSHTQKPDHSVQMTSILSMFPASVFRLTSPTLCLRERASSICLEFCVYIRTTVMTGLARMMRLEHTPLLCFGRHAMLDG
ncbi:hypothetical protein B0H13DRAFT_2328937 [Mycena leptocephala]|nr:hypothetical protein B0H13DRAFT_2328937 [Mycena leptocephala]